MDGEAYLNRRVIKLPLADRLFEDGVVIGNCDALLLSPHEGGEALGNLHVMTDDALHGVLELGRMGGLAKDAYLSWK